MKSFSVIRANPALSTNAKVIVTASYSLYLESIESSPELCASKYKHVLFNKDNFFNELVPFFYKNTPADVAFKVKYEDDADKMFNTFEHQFDDIYQMGCKYISDTFYQEEFECFAPLYIDPSSIPENFIIFRVDGPGIINLTKDNFKTEILDKFKCVTVFDLTPKTNVGEWIKRNFVDDASFPTAPFEIDWRTLEFSKWNGIEYESGGYCSKSFFLDETISTEQTFHSFESLITDGYRNNKVVFPNIVNFSFLFNDTPATPKALRKWSINRYFGFYIEKLEEFLSVSPYKAQKLVTGTVITAGNIISESEGGDPFVGGWTENTYVEINGIFYKVEKFTNTRRLNKRTKSRKGLATDELQLLNVVNYRIISDLDLSGLEGIIDANIINVDSSNILTFVNNQASYNKFINEAKNCDLFVIEIDDKWHVIRVDSNGSLHIQSDYGFKSTELTFEYYINEGDPAYKTVIPLIIDKDHQPPVFKIYKVYFSDIKDFETSIIDTNFSKFEYEKSDSLTDTQQLKLYSKDIDSLEYPQRLSEYVFNKELVHIPTSSEYIATGELFEVHNNELNSLWRKNITSTKWGYQHSNSHFDEEYRLNNSFIADDFNRVANVYETRPIRMENNLDYFYTINSSTTSYVEQSLHVQILDSNKNIDSFTFNPDLFFTGIAATAATWAYQGTYSGTISYFASLFDKKEILDSGSTIRNTKKYSRFNAKDSVITNHTVFKGIKFYLYDVDKLIIKNGSIDSIITKSTNDYEGYKFSVLMADSATGSVFPIKNELTWETFSQFNQEEEYTFGEKFIFNDIVFVYVGSTPYTLTNMSVYPGSPTLNNSTLTTTVGPQSLFTPLLTTDVGYTNGTVSWGTISGITSILWNPTKTYTLSPTVVYDSAVYHHGDYYSYSAGTVSFWNPKQNYNANEYIIFNGEYYRSLKSTNRSYPLTSKSWRVDNTLPTSTLKWNKVILWSKITPPAIVALNGKYAVHNDILWRLVGSYLDEPGTNASWTREYSLVDDTTLPYSITNNNIIKFNSRYYYCTSPTSNSTLENGINMYINNKNKEILLHIYINDNTYTSIKNKERDDLYNELFSKLTANNFINYMNNVSEKYGFSDTIKYYIDGATQSYNWTNLPVILLAEAPDQVTTKLNSYKVEPVSPNKNLIKAKFLLDKGTVKSTNELNYYNDIPLATNIIQHKGDNLVVDNIHGLKNLTTTSLYRFSGYYMPIFYDIELFNKVDNHNCKFDTSLSNFGIMKERKFSKINRKKNILKLKDAKDLKSIYPMIDEYGYGFKHYFIFKSTWDNKYYIECDEADPTQKSVVNQIAQSNSNTNQSL
jgi:hypothetical protein